MLLHRSSDLYRSSIKISLVPYCWSSAVTGLLLNTALSKHVGCPFFCRLSATSRVRLPSHVPDIRFTPDVRYGSRPPKYTRACGPVISKPNSSRRRRRTLSLLRSRAGPLAAGTPFGPSGLRRTSDRPFSRPGRFRGIFSVASSPRPPEVATAIFLPPISLTFLIYGDC